MREGDFGNFDVPDECQPLREQELHFTPESADNVDPDADNRHKSLCWFHNVSPSCQPRLHKLGRIEEIEHSPAEPNLKRYAP